MHYNNSFFSPQACDSILSEDCVCLVLKDFPSYTNLETIRQLILDEYPFLKRIQIIDTSILKCYFESITDVIEVGDGSQYGAHTAFIENQKEKEMMDENQKNVSQILFNQYLSQESQQNYMSSRKFEDFNISLKSIPENQKTNEIKKKLQAKYIHRPKIERLTSLEDEIVEMEKMRSKFDLFRFDNDDQDEDFSNKTMDFYFTANNQQQRLQNTFETDIGDNSKQHKCSLKDKRRSSDLETKNTLVNRSDSQFQIQQKDNQEDKETDIDPFSFQKLPKKEFIKLAFKGLALTGLIVLGYGGLKKYLNKA